MARVPTPEDVKAIAAMPDGAERNRAITSAYFELSTEQCRRMSGANWCTFATWASRQAGVTIRHEDLLEALRNRLRGSAVLRGPFRELAAAIAHRHVDLVEVVTARIGEIGPLRRAGEAVARGNRKVFEEIGFEFARFLNRFDSIAAIADADLDDFVGTLRDGDPPDGQRLLRQAFHGYRKAATAATPQVRAEWLLFANLSIGYHEQVRLQPEIRAALDSAVLDTGRLVECLLQQFGEREDPLRSTLRRFLPNSTARVRALAAQIAAEAATIVREIVTEHLMTLRLGPAVIRLGHDVQQPCPPELQRPNAPELVAFLALVDPHAESALGSGAEDWADFQQRMHFIAELFRAWQQDERILCAP